MAWRVVCGVALFAGEAVEFAWNVFAAWASVFLATAVPLVFTGLAVLATGETVELTPDRVSRLFEVGLVMWLITALALAALGRRPVRRLLPERWADAALVRLPNALRARWFA